MTASTTDRPTATGPSAAGSRHFDQDSADISSPPPDDVVDDNSGRKLPRGGQIVWALVVMLLLVVAIIATAKVVGWQDGKKLRKAKEENALRDLRNRVLTEDLQTGQFTRVFTRGGTMVAVWQASDGLKVCNLKVVKPTKEVPRYSTAAYTATPANFRAIQSNPAVAIGCWGTESTDSFGGG